MRKTSIILLCLVISLTGFSQHVKFHVEKKGHNVLTLATSPDNNLFATGGDDNKVVVWSLNEKKESITLSGATGWITALRFSKDGKYLASGDRAGKLIVYDVNTGSIAYHLEGHSGTVYMVDFNPKYNYLASAGADGKLKIWDLGTKQLIKETKVTDKELLVTRFSPDGNKVLTAGSDGQLKEWDVLSGNMVRTIDAHEASYIRAASYSEDGNLIASGSDDRVVKIWQTSNGKLVKELPKHHKKWIQSLDFASDNKHIVTGGHDGSVILWDIEKATQVASVKQGGSFVSGAVFSADLKSLISAGYGAKTTIWDLSHFNLTPSAPAADNNATTIASRNDTKTETATQRFELVQPRIKTGDKFVCLEDEIKVKGVIILDAGVREIFVSNEQSKQREKIRLQEGGLFEHNVKLAFLDNNITIEAYDTKGTKLEKKFIAYRIFDKNNSKELAKLSRSGTDYALIIATNTYTAMNNLLNPVFDANTIASELETNYNFQVEKLIDPSLDNIKLKIREYAKKLFSEDDQLFIFIAGHGEYDDFFKEGYIVTTDTRKGDEAKSSYLPHSTLRTYINSIPCNHILLAMDVCFGGTFDPHIASSRGNEDAAIAEKAHFIKRKLKNKTRIFLTSGGKEYVPDGRPGHHSPFARKFIESLRSYGGADRILTYKEIINNVESVVPEPRYGEFGDNEPGSDFLFIAR